ncbi:MAG: hypothetical protein U0X58_04005 [Flavobacteriaceae bacterium]
MNSALTPITYQIQYAGASGATITGLPAGLTTSYSASGEFRISEFRPLRACLITALLPLVVVRVLSYKAPLMLSHKGTFNLTFANATQTVCINTSISPIRYQITKLSERASAVCQLV